MKKIGPLHLFVLLPFVLFFLSGVLVEAGEPWGWPPYVDNDLNPEPAGQSRISDSTALYLLDLDSYGNLPGEKNERIGSKDVCFEERPMPRDNEIPWTFWFNLLTQIYY